MASDVQTTSAETDDAPRTRIEDHMATYDGFMAFTKIGIVLVALLLVGMLIFLV